MATVIPAPKYYIPQYYFEFSSAPDDNGVSTDYRVELNKRSSVPDFGAKGVEIEPGPAPFILSLGNDNDPLATTRTSSAQISFFDDVELSQILPADATQWQATLTRISDNKRIFIGYLTAEVYTQPYIEGPNVVTIIAASPLVPILAESMSVENKGMITIGGLIAEALAQVNGIEEVYIPALYTADYPSATSQYTDVLRFTLAQAMYIHPSDTAAITGKEYEADTYDKPLEAICKLFGWSMVDVGDGALYFVVPGYKGKYMRLSLDDLTAEQAFTPTLVTPWMGFESNIEPIDKGDTVEMQQGVGSVMLEVKATDIKVNTPNPEDYITSQVFSRRRAEYPDSVNPKAKSEIAKITTTIQHPHITLYNYTLSRTPDASGNIIESWTPTKGLTSTACAGAEFQKFDWANPDKIAITAEDRKSSWTFTPAFFVKEVAAIEGSYIQRDMPGTLPIMSARFGTVFLSSGAVCVNLSVLAEAAEGFYIARDGVVGGGTLETPTDDVPAGLDRTFWSNYNKVIRCSLRIGKHWWNGTRWTAEESIFYLPLSTDEAEWHPPVSNKTIDMLYEEGEGVYLHINTPLSGDVEMIFYRTEVLDHGELVSGYNGSWYLKGLSLEYKPTLDQAIPSLADTTYYRSFRLCFTEQKEVTLSLHSRINGAEQMSLLYKDATSPLDKFYRATHTDAAKPEQFLLDEYQRLYGRALRRWRRGMMMRELRPIDLYSRAEAGSVLSLTGYTADFEGNTIIAYLSDTKEISPVHYV